MRSPLKVVFLQHNLIRCGRVLFLLIIIPRFLLFLFFNALHLALSRFGLIHLVPGTESRVHGVFG